MRREPHMLLDKVFKPFIEDKPICVMARAVLQRILDPHHLDQLFARTAKRQYTHELLFSSLVDLMTRVVLGQEPSVHAAYRQLQDQLPVSDQSVYNKLQHVELAVSAALVHDSALRVAPVLGTLRASLAPLLPGYRVKFLVLPFLGVDSEECSPNAAGEFVHLPDSPADGLADPIDVQAQPIPEGLGILDPITTLGNHPGLIVQPFHDATTLPLPEVSQDPVPMGIEGRKEPVQLLVLFLQKRPIGRQLLGSVVLVAGLIKDFRHPPPEPVDKLQRRNFPEHPFQPPPLPI